jgi:GT2 family glycosyltransferase
VKTVVIAIPSLHRPDLTQRCIETIQLQTLPADEWEIVVIENEARPDAMLPDPLPPHTRRIELPNNEGTTGSINRGMASVPSRYVLLLNNDIELGPDYLEKLVAVMEAEPKLGFVTGKLLRATQRTHLDGAGDAMIMAGGAYRLGNLDPDDGRYGGVMPILTGCGAAVMYRAKAFLLSGGLDTEFFAYLDDVDLALRIHLIGYSGLYVPDAVAYHVGSATFGRLLHPRIVEYVTRNQIYLITKDYPQAVFKKLQTRIFVYQAMWLFLCVAQGNLGRIPPRPKRWASRTRQHERKTRPTHGQTEHQRR